MPSAALSLSSPSPTIAPIPSTLWRVTFYFIGRQPRPRPDKVLRLQRPAPSGASAARGQTQKPRSSQYPDPAGSLNSVLVVVSSFTLKVSYQRHHSP
eukprot:scaffold31528_cov57-Phaeocystis_antarctica.AAC.2